MPPAAHARHLLLCLLAVAGFRLAAAAIVPGVTDGGAEEECRTEAVQDAMRLTTAVRRAGSAARVVPAPGWMVDAASHVPVAPPVPATTLRTLRVRMQV